MPRYEFLCEKCKKVQEAVRAHDDDLGAREDEGQVPQVQRHEGRSPAQRLHGADEEEELTALATDEPEERDAQDPSQSHHAQL